MDYENQLLLTAFKLFLSNNYEKVTIEMIEKESGITRKTLYRHLGSKDNVFIISTHKMSKKKYRHLPTWVYMILSSRT